MELFNEMQKTIMYIVIIINSNNNHNKNPILLALKLAKQYMILNTCNSYKRCLLNDEL